MCLYLKKLNIRCITAILFSILLLCIAGEKVTAADANGTCGANLNWTLEAGTLTITGSGAMEDFTEPDMAPWYAYREEILRVILPEELTNVGNLAFYQCENLTAVVVPDTVERIGEYAFSGCTDMELLQLGNQLQIVEEGAFSECLSLAAVRLPNTVHTLGLKAFYRCESLTVVTIPESVRNMGTSVFAYCINLISAYIEASVETLPEWLFYGCTKLDAVILGDGVQDISDYVFRGCEALNTVYYDGENMTKQEILDIVEKDLPNFQISGAVLSGQPSGAVESEKITENSDGSVTQQNTKVEQGNHSSVTTTVQSCPPAENFADSQYKADITVTVDSEEGWDEAQNALEDTLKEINNQYSTKVEGGLKDIEITVYVKNQESISQSFIDSMAGRDVNVTFITANGSIWRLECAEMAPAEPEGNYNLNFTLTACTEEQRDALGVTDAYLLNFHASAEVNAEVLIRLPKQFARQKATLFQKQKEDYEQIQTVVIDTSGYAHFYLASVTKEMEYFIAVNVPASVEGAEEVIIPENMLEEYGDIIQYQPIQYEFTGRKSSWGMELNHVTWLLIGVIFASVVGVGVTMFVLNKRKLARGHAPEVRK